MVTPRGLSSWNAGGKSSSKQEQCTRTVMQNRGLNVVAVSFLYHRLVGFKAPYLQIHPSEERHTPANTVSTSQSQPCFMFISQLSESSQWRERSRTFPVMGLPHSSSWHIFSKIELLQSGSARFERELQYGCVLLLSYRVCVAECAGAPVREGTCTCR